MERPLDLVVRLCHLLVNVLRGRKRKSINLVYQKERGRIRSNRWRGRESTQHLTVIFWGLPVSVEVTQSKSSNPLGAKVMPRVAFLYDPFLVMKFR